MREENSTLIAEMEITMITREGEPPKEAESWTLLQLLIFAVTGESALRKL